MIKKFYPSSAAFMLGDTVVTKYDSGCLRKILISANGIRAGEIPLVYQRVGAAMEEHHARTLQDLGERVDTWSREDPIKKKLSANVEYSGRTDFLVQMEGSPDVIVHETKGTISKNQRRDIRNGEYNLNYLAQIVSYMVKLKTDKGKIIRGYFEKNVDGSLQYVEGRTFKVQILSLGEIYVDADPSYYNVADLLAHERAAVKVLETGHITARPDKWNQKWGGPCTMCAFKETCDKYDASPTSDRQFLADAELAAAKIVPKPEPVPFNIKPPKAPKVPKPRRKKDGKS